MIAVTLFFFFQAEDGIRDLTVTGVQTCALPISRALRGLCRHDPVRRIEPAELARRRHHSGPQRRHRRRRSRQTPRSEEHTSELQSQSNLVCRLLLEKKKKKNKNIL